MNVVSKGGKIRDRTRAKVSGKERKWERKSKLKEQKREKE